MPRSEGRYREKEDGCWLEVRGKVIRDAREKDRRIVGYIRDIHETKMRELDQERKQQMDPVTSFYRLKPGMEEIRRIRRTIPEGMMILVDICRFTVISRDFGLTFGDVLLEQFSKMFYRSVKKGCQYTGDDQSRF